MTAPNVEATASERKGNSTLDVPYWLLQSTECGGWGVGDGGMASLDSCSRPRATPSVPQCGTPKTIATVLSDSFHSIQAASVARVCSHSAAAACAADATRTAHPPFTTALADAASDTRAITAISAVPAKETAPFLARRRSGATTAVCGGVPPPLDAAPLANPGATNAQTHPAGHCTSDRAAVQRDLQRMVAAANGAAAAADAAPTRSRLARPPAWSPPPTHPPPPQYRRAPGGRRLEASSRSGGGGGALGVSASECCRGGGGANYVGARTKEVGERWGRANPPHGRSCHVPRGRPPRYRPARGEHQRSRSATPPSGRQKPW